MSDVVHVWPPKHPDADLDYGVDFESECARRWSRWTDYVQNDCIRVYTNDSSAGLEMKCTTAGRTAGRPPRFPTTAAGTVADGSVVWTAQAISSASLVRTISGIPTWVALAGVTVSNQAKNGMFAIANISSGIDGQDYAVTVTASMSDGNDVVKVCRLPVRIPLADAV